MWCVLDLDGNVIFRDRLWDRVVSWAMRAGGELDIVFSAWVGDGDFE